MARDEKIHSQRCDQSPTLASVEEFRVAALRDLLGQCTVEQQAFFRRGYPYDSLEEMPLAKIERGIEHCEATIKMNAQRQSSSTSGRPGHDGQAKER